jgi:SAM-dependent methyltransferase
MQLLLGAGSRRDKLLYQPGKEHWDDLVTLDMNPDHKPDVVWDMEKIPLPFEDNSADEIHAYEVLEHMGRQGDWRFFLAQFEDFWRILKPGGVFYATTPHPTSPWAFGDPGHTRLLPVETTVFLDQEEYRKQVGVTPLTDYRHWYKGDFRLVFSDVTPKLTTRFALQAVK